jgi:exopolysaccharide production protein ExoZ
MTAQLGTRQPLTAERWRTHLAWLRGNPSGDQIVLLQFLRGIAASGVVVEHLLERYARRGALPGALPEFTTRLGQVGVATFFTISGFIMVFIALREPGRTPSGSAFLRNRFLRVAPLYYLMTLLIVMFGIVTQSFATTATRRVPSIMEVVFSLAFIPHRGNNGLIQPIYGLGWTLHYEMFFYLLFALGLSLLRRRGVLLVLGTLALLILIGMDSNAPPDVWGLAIVIYVFTRPIMAYFAIGIVIALIRRPLAKRLPVMSAPVIATLALITLGIAAATGERIVAMPAIAVAVSCTVMLDPGERWRTGVFSRFSRAFGDASYSIYLTHSFLLGAFAFVTARLASRGYVALGLLTAVACAGCFIAGLLTWRLVEVPITTRLRGRRPTIETVAP